MPSLAEFYLASPASVVELELFEVTHPSFSTTFRFVRNARAGVTVTLEDSSTGVFVYLPVQISRPTSSDNLDQVFQIKMGDLGTIIPNEIDLCETADTLGTSPVVRYWTYRSDDLTAPMFGPVSLEITDTTSDQDGFGFEAHAPYLNLTRTGEQYSINRFNALRGFL